MYSRRRRTLIRLTLAAAAATLAVAPASAEAATKTVGSALPPPPEFGSVGQGCPREGGTLFSPKFPTCTAFQYVLPDRLVTSPGKGRVIRWRLRGSEGRFRLRVLRNLQGKGVKAVGQSAAVKVTGGSKIRVFRTSLPIRKGDYIGVDLLNPDSTVGLAPARGAKFGVFGPKLGASETRDRFFGPFEGDQLLLNADVKLAG